MTPSSVRQPRVFVLYAHDSDGHKGQVRELCAVLRDGGGVDVHVDEQYVGLRQDWSVWAMAQLRAADFLLVVASPDLKRRAEGLAAPDEGRGAQFEMSILRELLAENRVEWTRKILPIVLPGRSIEEIPLFLLPRNADHYVITELSMAGMGDLLKALTGRPHPQAPPPPPPPPRPDSFGGTAGSVWQDAFATEHSSVQQAGGDIHNTTYYGGPRRRVLIFGAFGTVIALAATVWIVWPDSQGWREVLSRNDVSLTPQSFSCLGVNDKVDLDTGKPGRGLQPQISPCKADGGLADLIMDETGLHTPGPNMLNLLPVNRDPVLSAEACDSMFNDPAAKVRSNVAVQNLQAGDQLCVRTDKGNVARVTFARARAETAPGIVINYVVWEKQT